VTYRHEDPQVTSLRAQVRQLESELAEERAGRAWDRSNRRLGVLGQVVLAILCGAALGCALVALNHFLPEPQPAGPVHFEEHRYRALPSDRVDATCIECPRCVWRCVP
jgi:hypothetical protein